MKKSVVWIAVIAVLVVGGVVLSYLNKSGTTKGSPSSADVVAALPQTTAPEQEPENQSATTQQNTGKEFVVTGSNFAFAPATLTVKKGATVKITFKNADGFHDFRIDEFNVATKRIRSGAEETVTFVADKMGAFEYYCSVGQHRAMGMKGTLTVE
jgi:nitrosocyanin